MTCQSSRIVLIEDHLWGMEALRSGLRELPDAMVVAVAQSAEAALRLASLNEATLALIDVSLPDMSGMQLVRRFRGSHPELRCLMLSAHAQQSKVLEALAAGAWGYVVKDSAVELIQAIQSVRAGKVFLSKILGGRIHAEVCLPAHARA